MDGDVKRRRLPCPGNRHAQRHADFTHADFQLISGCLNCMVNVFRCPVADRRQLVANHFQRLTRHRTQMFLRRIGVELSMEEGKAATYAIDGLQDRGYFFVSPGEWCYTGQIVGEHCKDNDLVVNVQRGKKLTNMRASGSDRKLFVVPAVKLSIEEAIEYINDDELVEITPEVLRLRKYFLDENERKRKRDHDWTQAG